MGVAAPITDLGYHEAFEKAFSEKVRDAILERDHVQCQSCGQGGDNRLAIHHVVFRSQGGAGTEDNGVTLCHDCHTDVHQGLLTPALLEWMPGAFAWFFRRLTRPKRWTTTKT